MARLLRAAAAWECMNISIDQWAASEGATDLATLVDHAFAVLEPQRHERR